MDCNVDFAIGTLAYHIVQLVLLLELIAAANVSELFNLVCVNQPLRLFFQLCGRHRGNVIQVERCTHDAALWP